MAKGRTVAQRTTATSLVKPSELIDVEEMVELKLVDRRIFNLLLANAWEDIEVDKEHCISKKEGW